MSFTPKALILRIEQMRKAAMKEFASNPYVTIHDYSKSSGEKGNPFTVWIDLNYPVYILKNKKPVLKSDGVKGICIKFKTTYPEERPSVTLPVDIASIHTWDNKTACTHTMYNPATHDLVKEITNIMALAANCPEGINYKSPTPDHRWLIKWTEKSLQSGELPTVPYKRLFMIEKASRRRMMRPL